MGYDEISVKESVDADESFEGTEERKKKRSGLKEWDKRTGAKIYHMTENVSESGRKVIRSLSRNRSREPSSEPAYSRESDNTSTRENVDPNETYDEVSAMDKVDINITYDEIPARENVDLNGSCRETIERKKKKSGLKEWDKRTGAKIYHMTENISEKGL